MARYGDLDSLATKWTLASPTQRQNFKQIIEEQPPAEVVPKSEVARIFEDMEKLVIKIRYDLNYFIFDLQKDFAELKKKYTEDRT